MLNALWLNAQELGADGSLVRVIELGATHSAGASVAPSAVVKRFGLEASVSGGAPGYRPTPPPSPPPDYTGVAHATLAIRKPMAALPVAGAVGQVSMSPSRNMAAHGYVLTDSFLGGSFSIFLEGSVNAGATGVLYPFDKLFDGAVSAGATAAVELTRTKMLGASVAMTTTVADAITNCGRQAYANPSVGASATAVPDTTVGGVRYAGLAGLPIAGADAECTIDPKKAIYANASVLATAQGDYLARTIPMACNPQLAGASTFDPISLHSVDTCIGQPVTVGAPSSEARLYRTTRFASAAVLGGAKTILDPRVSVDMFLGGTGLGGADASWPLLQHYRGLSADVMAGASVAPATSSQAEKLYGSGFAEVTAEPLEGVYFTIFQLAADATINIDATAQVSQEHQLAGNVLAGADANPPDMRVNLYQLEPDFRTIIVDPGDWSEIIDPADWTLLVTDDVTAMKTFQKQPAEVLAYDIDFREWFEQITSDDISTAVCVVTAATDSDPTQLAVDSVVLVAETTGGPAKIAKVWLSGGLNGVTYKLTLTMTTEAGRVTEVDFKMKVKEI